MPLNIVEDTNTTVSSDDQLPAWAPQPGDVLRGNYIGRRDGLGPRNSTIYNFKLDSGEVQGVWHSKAIGEAIDKASVGDYFIIVFIKKILLDNGNNFNKFAIAFEPESPDEEEIKEFIEANGGTYKKPSPAPAKEAADEGDDDVPF